MKKAKPARRKAIRIDIHLMAKALTAMSKTSGGLTLVITKEGSVEVKPYAMTFWNEVVFVQKKKDRILRILITGREFRVCGGARKETPLHIWATAAQFSVGRKNPCFPVLPSDMTFDLF